MKKTMLAIAVLALLATAAFAANGTDTATQSLQLDVEYIQQISVTPTGSSPDITLTIAESATTAGSVPTADTDATTQLEYTSTVGASETRKVTIEWGGADVAPAGTELKAQASSVPADCGEAAAQTNAISSTAQDLITGIGSCNTDASGPTVTYTFSVSAMTSLVAAETKTVTITHTLTTAAGAG